MVQGRADYPAPMHYLGAGVIPLTSTERPNTLAGLVEKRAEIAGQLAHTRAVLRQLIIDLDHVDAAIRLFDPNYDIEGIRQKIPTKCTPGDSWRHDAGNTRRLARCTGADDAAASEEARHSPLGQRSAAWPVRSLGNRGLGDGSRAKWKLARPRHLASALCEGN